MLETGCYTARIMSDSSLSLNGMKTSARIASGSISLAMLNAVARQQLDAIEADAVTLMGASAMISLATAELAGKQAAHPTPAALGSPAQDTSAAPTAPAANPQTDTAAGVEAVEDATEAAARMIALTVALTVQDAANYLRNLQTLSTASIICTAIQTYSTPHASQGAPELTAPLPYVEQGAAQLEKVGSWATQLLAQLRALRPTAAAKEPSAGQPPRANLLESAANALSTAMQNAVSNQQQVNQTSQASAVMGIATLYSLDTASTGRATQQILDGAEPPAQQLEAADPAQ